MQALGAGAAVCPGGAAATVWSAEPCAEGKWTHRTRVFLTRAPGSNLSYLPCRWGGCEFRKDATGVLARSGTCSSRFSVKLWLNCRGITGLSAGVFDEIGAVDLDLSDNQLTSLPAGVFDPLTQLTSLVLRSNTMRSLPKGVFDSLTQLKTLDLGSNLLKCAPFSEAQRMNITTYIGPCKPCMDACPAGQDAQYIGPRWDCIGGCRACASGKYKLLSGSESCSKCGRCPELHDRTGCGGSSGGSCSLSPYVALLAIGFVPCFTILSFQHYIYRTRLSPRPASRPFPASSGTSALPFEAGRQAMVPVAPELRPGSRHRLDTAPSAPCCATARTMASFG
jgi:hypothetical protein